jgi:molybdate transport system substrate-binding protein
MASPGTRRSPWYRLEKTPLAARDIFPPHGRPARRSVAATLAFLAVAGCSRRPEPRALHVAAAADLRFALESLAPAFRTQSGAELRATYGSSGNLYAQISNRAPYDLFLSADAEYPRRLAREGVARADSVFVYGFGRLVVWVPAASPLDPAAALRAPSLRRLAIANPRHAPYGRAAEAALRSLHLYDALQPKLVYGDNVMQALEFVRSGAADAGIVALALALAPPLTGQGRYWEIPHDAYPAMEQAGVILKPSAAALRFRTFLLVAQGRAALERFGFALPPQ